MAQVGIIMGSKSDLPIMKEAKLILDQFGISSEVEIVSAHRTPEKMVSYAKEAAGRGLKVIIAGAGGAALGDRILWIARGDLDRQRLAVRDLARQERVHEGTGKTRHQASGRQAAPAADAGEDRAVLEIGRAHV